MEALILCLLMLNVCFALVDDQPYCSLRYRRLCQGKGRHVACQFPFPGPSESCSNYTKIKFTSDLKSFITHFINRRRQRIATGNERVRGGALLPKPEVTMWVGWDRELAHLAQRLADQCRFVHDDCRATVRYPYAGQTVGEVRWRRSSDSDELSAQRAIRRVFDAWWGERRRVQPKQLIAPFRLTAKGSVWGHFSQLAVWTLRAVGCGAVRHGGTHTRLLLVCDFSHTNMLGERTINPGPLAACPAHTARKMRSAYPLLCAPVRQQSISSDTAYEDTNNEEINYDEVPKPVTKYQAHKESRNYNKPGYEMTTAVKTTRFVDVLEQELDRPLQTKMQVRIWPTRPPRIEVTLRYKDVEEKMADKIQYVYRSGNQDVGTTKDSRPLIYDRIHKEQSLRQKWKQTRFRPQRPGAKALLEKPEENAVKQTSKPSLMIDKDDVDQLFRDTGFKITRRKN
ncbi:unnamed protein product [Leptosia nina]|uniref:SCP domain-containing protein n=1 Tax=Leptosia nina TaxID=320188 RepID=A0AAV1IVL0_9NEOP